LSRSDDIRKIDENLKALGKTWVDIAISPSSPEPTPSAFHDWVFRSSTYEHILPKTRTESTHLVEERLKQGIWDHRRIELFFLDKWAQLNFPGTSYSQWDKVFIDRHDDNREGLLASRLIVGGNPLREKPDAVFRHKNTNTILIVERKTTGVPCDRIPQSGWPNIQAHFLLVPFLCTSKEKEPAVGQPPTSRFSSSAKPTQQIIRRVTAKNA
jgi:hypothetical protein